MVIYDVIMMCRDSKIHLVQYLWMYADFVVIHALHLHKKISYTFRLQEHELTYDDVTYDDVTPRNNIFYKP